MNAKSPVATTRRDTTAVSPDLAALEGVLTDAEKAVRDRVRDFCDQEVLPRINYYWERAEVPPSLRQGLGNLGLAGGSSAGGTSPPMTKVADGLVAAEFARADGSVRDLQSVHDMAMGSIARFGSPEQADRWLPPMRRVDKFGAFALTEPAHGSDAANIQTRATRDGASYVLRGRKRWITNAGIAEIIVVWAKDDDGAIGGFVVEAPTPGFVCRAITGKTACRAVPHADVLIEDVRVPSENRLTGVTGFRDLAAMLSASRTLVAWEALGHAVGAYEVAVAYASEREQFGRPLGAFQLVQGKLAEMLISITAMQLMCWRSSTLDEQGQLTPPMAAATKAHTTAAARQVVLDARDVLGGNGVLLENHVARHHADIEASFTYEGTYDVNRLLIGRHITGLSAFSG